MSHFAPGARWDIHPYLLMYVHRQGGFNLAALAAATPKATRSTAPKPTPPPSLIRLLTSPPELPLPGLPMSFLGPSGSLPPPGIVESSSTGLPRLTGWNSLADRRDRAYEAAGFDD